MSAIDEVLEYANAINCKSAFQPTIDAARAELADLRLKAADRNEWQDAATKVATERDQLLQSTAAMRDELEHLRFKWDSETCPRCNYMRSPVSPCKCGQSVRVGTNDRLRMEITGCKQEIIAYHESTGELKLANAELNAQLLAMRDELERVKGELAEKPMEREWRVKALAMLQERDQMRDELERVRGLLDERLNEIAGSQAFVREYQETRQAYLEVSEQLAGSAKRRAAYQQETEQLRDQLAEQSAKMEQGLDAEQARWQQAIYERLCHVTKDVQNLNIDGAGCDSGDPLDFTLSEIAQAISAVIEQREEALAKMASLEAQSDEFKDIAYQASLTNDRLAAKNERLESQAGAMREALMYTNNTLVVQNYPTCRCGANTACDEPHYPDCVTIGAMDKAKAALSSQAGTDQSARVQALEADKARLEG